jgi:hypothetical protein
MAAKIPSLPSTAPAVASAAAGPDFESGKLGPTPIRDLALSLEDSPLAPVLAELGRELESHGIRRLRPHFYLSTPDHDWRAEYAAWPVALAKLEYCDRTMAEVAGQEPIATAVDRDVDVSEVATALDDFYSALEPPAEDLPPGLDGALRSVFADLRADDAGDRAGDRAGELAGDGAGCRPAAELIRRLGRQLPAEVYRWTGHFPERTRRLLLQLGARADALRLAYPAALESEAVMALTTLVTALAMNYVHGGSYAP